VTLGVTLIIGVIGNVLFSGQSAYFDSPEYRARKAAVLAA